MTTEIWPFLYWKHHFLYLMNEIENFYDCSTRQQSHCSVYFNKVVRPTEVIRLIYNRIFFFSIWRDLLFSLSRVLLFFFSFSFFPSPHAVFFLFFFFASSCLADLFLIFFFLFLSCTLSFNWLSLQFSNWNFVNYFEFLL